VGAGCERLGLHIFGPAGAIVTGTHIYAVSGTPYIAVATLTGSDNVCFTLSVRVPATWWESRGMRFGRRRWNGTGIGPGAGIMPDGHVQAALPLC
jgi:hypothetical protein